MKLLDSWQRVEKRMKRHLNMTLRKRMKLKKYLKRSLMMRRTMMSLKKMKTSKSKNKWTLKRSMKFMATQDLSMNGLLMSIAKESLYGERKVLISNGIIKRTKSHMKEVSLF